MTVKPSHTYRARGLEQGVPLEIVQNAIEQAREPLEKGLPAILTLNHLAFLTGTNYKTLRNIVERESDPYRTFQISKHSGGWRTICVPNPEALAVQSWLNKQVLEKISPHPRSFAFMPKSSVVKCASEHCGCGWLIKLDVRRFFESISEIKVYHSFQSMGYQGLVAFELARICTRLHPETGKVRRRSKWLADPTKYATINAYWSRSIGYLPQGAPTSPRLANLASYDLDNTVQSIARDFGLTYTRYADDMAFSASTDFSFKMAHTFVRKVYRAMKKYKFEPNTTKTIIAPPGARKIVLGLLVDQDQPRLTREFRNKLNMHIWAIGKFGFAKHAHHLGFKSLWGFQRHLEGLIAYSKMVQPEFANEIQTKYQEVMAKDGWNQELY